MAAPTTSSEVAVTTRTINVKVQRSAANREVRYAMTASSPAPMKSPKVP